MLFKRRPGIDEIREAEAESVKHTKFMFHPPDYFDDVSMDLGAVFPSSVLVERLPGIERYLQEEPNPESVDMPITRLYRTGRGGRGEISRSEEIEPDEIFVGFCPISPDIHEGESLCLETRSNVARTMMNVCGFDFVNRESMVSGFSPFLWSGDRTDDGFYVVLANRATVPYVMDKLPFSPFQVSLATRAIYNRHVTESVRLMVDGEDVSEGLLGNMHLPGYTLTLAPEISFMEKVPGARIRYSQRKEDAGKLLHTELIDDIDDKKLALPSLTISNESIVNNIPAYAFPFHIKDAHCFIGRNSGCRFRAETLENTLLHRLEPIITGNSGLHHVGSSGRMVFENTPGYMWDNFPADAREYFEVGSPYAYLIPVPLAGSGVPVTRYSGASGHQNEICIQDSISRN